jgi:hypothetical protein
MPAATDLVSEFFTQLSNGNVGKVSAILKDHPEAVEWRYTLNGLNQPVTMIAHDLAVLKLLLDHKADPNAADRTGQTRLIDCGDNADAVNLLLDYGANIDQPNENGTTPLMRAAFNKCTAVVHALLARDANADAVNKDGKTAEAIARERFNPDLADEIRVYSETKSHDQLVRDIDDHFHTGLDHETTTLRPLRFRRKQGPTASFMR